MISSGWLLAIYCVFVLIASLAGGWLPLLVKLTHTRLQVAISLVAGLMLGIALLHFLPDANEHLGSLDRTVAWMLGGFLSMFFLQRFFHFHHHDLPEGDPEDCCHEEHGEETHERAPEHGHEHDHGHAHSHHVHEHGHEHDHDHPNEHGHEHVHAHTLAEKSARQLSWVGTALGLTLHSLLDGLAMAAAFEASARGQGLAGMGTALAVILHKPFDAMAVSTLMTAGGSSRFSTQLLNVLFSLATPLGAALFYLGANHLASSNVVFLGCALAFCAGTFLCIASSDLLPELQFHSHDRLKLSVALLLGIGVAVLIGVMEPHEHEQKVPTTKIQAPAKTE